MRASEYGSYSACSRAAAARCRSTGNTEGRLLSGCLALHSERQKASQEAGGSAHCVERLRVDNGERPAATRGLHAESTERKEQVGAGGGGGGRQRRAERAAGPRRWSVCRGPFEMPLKSSCRQRQDAKGRTLHKVYLLKSLIYQNTVI